MSELTFEILGAPGEVAASTFKSAMGGAVDILREFDCAISGRPRGSLNWYIGKLYSNGHLSVVFQSRIKPVRRVRERPIDFSPEVTTNFLTGFEDLEERCETPQYLSEVGLQKVGDLANLLNKNGASGFTFTSEKRTVEVTKKTQENLGKLLPIRRTSIGSVEGKLEAINLHKTERFIVYHSVTNKGVACFFNPEQLTMLDVKNALGKRVAVFGTLHKNIRGDTLRVDVERMVQANDRDRFLIHHTHPANQPDITRAESTAEYLRRVRGG